MAFLIYLKSKSNQAITLTSNVVTAQGAINNPGNIRKSNEIFLGEINPGTSENFKSFASLAYGFRAMIKILRSYYSQGYTTLEKMIYHWAPPSENPSESYVNYISEKTGIDKRTDMLNVINSANVANVVYWMAKFEQGNSFMATIDHAKQGYNLA